MFLTISWWAAITSVVSKCNHHHPSLKFFINTTWTDDTRVDDGHNNDVIHYSVQNNMIFLSASYITTHFSTQNDNETQNFMKCWWRLSGWSLWWWWEFHICVTRMFNTFYITTVSLHVYHPTPHFMFWCSSTRFSSSWCSKHHSPLDVMIVHMGLNPIFSSGPLCESPSHHMSVCTISTSLFCFNFSFPLLIFFSWCWFPFHMDLLFRKWKGEKEVLYSFSRLFVTVVYHVMSCCSYTQSVHCSVMREEVNEKIDVWP